jgi:hypothetical protein
MIFVLSISSILPNFINVFQCNLCH